MNTCLQGATNEISLVKIIVMFILALIQSSFYLKDVWHCVHIFTQKKLFIPSEGEWWGTVMDYVSPSKSSIFHCEKIDVVSTNSV